MKNIFYFSVINNIGGVESYYYYLAKKYSAKDITIYYKRGDPEQIRRLSKYVRVRRYTGEKIVCDRAFFNYAADIIGDVEAKEYIQIIHADYKEMKLRPVFSPKITKFIGVSKYICERFKEYTGRDIELCYNPIDIDPPKKIIHLISATRLTEEKGRDRMEILARELDKHDVLFQWMVFTDCPIPSENPNVVYRKPRLDITSFIADADYLVQLSDTEAYCFSVVEALMLGTPAIVTPCDAFKEVGVNEKNGIIIPFDMGNIPIEKIVNGLEPFKYKPPKEEWGKLLAKGKSTYGQDEAMLVECTQNYYDLELDRQVMRGEEIYMPFTRAEYLIGLGLQKWKSGDR